MWGRRHQYVNLSFLGIFNFTAPYLPWVLLAFSIMLGSSPKVDLLGMVAGERPRPAAQRRGRAHGWRGWLRAAAKRRSQLAPPPPTPNPLPHACALTSNPPINSALPCRLQGTHTIS